MRSGTVPHVLAVGLGAACEVAQEEMEVAIKKTIDFCVFCQLNSFFFQ